MLVGATPDAGPVDYERRKECDERYPACTRYMRYVTMQLLIRFRNTEDKLD